MASGTKDLADDAKRPPLELTFWRTLYRYLLSIVASLACGFIWTKTGARLLHLQVLPTIYTGVISLAIGFLLMGYLWLSIDLAHPAPEGLNEGERNTQLFILWLGIPLAVIAICAVVALLAVLLGATVLNSGLPGQH
jgi:heme/copper-type cytochrome/quinol oxidase subunit 2